MREKKMQEEPRQQVLKELSELVEKVKKAKARNPAFKSVTNC